MHMNKNYPCEIIRDLLPGYVDEILSEQSTDIVKEHLNECEKCRQAYEEMKKTTDEEITPKEQIALDGFKKVRRSTNRIKLITGIVTGLLISGLLAIFLRVYIIGEPAATSAISANEISYDEETDTLTINGTVNFADCRVSRVLWEPDENRNAINVIVYTVETLPFQKSKTDFTISISDMKGKCAYLACPDYDQAEIYDYWKYEQHYRVLAELENEIYNSLHGLDMSKDALNYLESVGIQFINKKECVGFSVFSIIGEDATFWRENNMLYTDGEFNPRNFEIWISLEEPREIYIYDYETGEYSNDYTIITED